MKLRTNQQILQDQTFNCFAKGAKCVMPTMATGGGKSLLISDAVLRMGGRGVVQAHRAELVGQLSLTLARAGIPHNISASVGVTRQIIDTHLSKLGCSYYRPEADWSVESVQTAVRRSPRCGVTSLIQDEAHHVLRDNTWGKAIQQYPNLKHIYLPTATPGRTDGKGLGLHADGYVQALVSGPTTAQLMQDGFLVEYDILHATAADLDLSGVHVSSNGEYNQIELAEAISKSTALVGDTVRTWQEHAGGQRTITFAQSVASGTELAAAYRAAGIPAEFVDGLTPDAERIAILARFEAGATLVLVNVDLLGEGIDIPNVAVVQMCRPTASMPLYKQQVGRLLRLAITPTQQSIWDSLTPTERKAQIATSVKPRGLLIDHVGNVMRKFNIANTDYIGPPEGFEAWTLDGKTRRNAKLTPTRICHGCYQLYEAYHTHCPYCGTAPKITPNLPRQVAQQVPGSLQWYDRDALAAIRARIAQIDGPAPTDGVGVTGRAIAKKWHARQDAQHALRAAIAQWAARHNNHSDETNYRKFAATFGVDVPTACTLSASRAEILRQKIISTL